MWQRIFILLAFSLLIEAIVYFGLRKMLKRLKGSYLHDVFMFIHWTIPIAIIIFFVIQVLRIGDPGLDYQKFRSFFVIFGIFLLFFAPRLTFAASTLLQTLYYLIKNLVVNKKGYIVKRTIRKSYLIQKIGLVLSLGVFVMILHGMIWGKTNYQVQQVEVSIKNLPNAFDGYKILHFSDAHMGSFQDVEEGKIGISIIDNQKVDLIVFTGDMVNNVADEMIPYIDAYKNLNAPDGKFAILGNHDMGDYVKWNEMETKEEHLTKLVNFHHKAGFSVLRNRSVIIKKAKDSIALIGIDNWGRPPFKQYGDLKLAMKNIKKVETKVLLSHDPSHWKSEVTKSTDIDLALAGHTHGMQFGFKIGDFKWSPSKWIYPEWWGLYTQNQQHLYVNPGFGFIGFPGRVGIPPEITVITLRKALKDDKG